MTNCKGCGHPVKWVVTAKNKKRMPVDMPPEKRIILNSNDEAEVVTTYVSHFAHCQFADQFRGKK